MFIEFRSRGQNYWGFYDSWGACLYIGEDTGDTDERVATYTLGGSPEEIIEAWLNATDPFFAEKLELHHGTLTYEDVPLVDVPITESALQHYALRYRRYWQPQTVANG